METRKYSPKTGAVLSTLLSSLMLGTSYVAIKMAVGTANPFLLGAAVMAVGSALLIGFMLWRGTLTRAMLKRWEFWAASVVNTGVVAPSYLGLTLTTASAAGLIIGTNVIFVAFFSHLLFKESISRRRLMGMAVALLGLITLTTRWDLSVLTESQMTGNLLVLLSAACIGAVVVLSRVALRNLGPDQWTLGLHLFLPAPLLVLWLAVPVEGGLTVAMFPAIVFIGVVCTTVPSVLWIAALRHISVVTSATVLMVESAFAVFLSWLFLGETLDIYVAIGALMIFSAILLLTRTD